jgi:DNA-binding beta-propeller fold protein YncE
MYPKRLFCLLFIAIAAGSAQAADAKFPDYRAVPNWAKLPDNVKLGGVSAVATDSADNVFVFHRGKQPVLVFDRDGKFLRSWGDEHLKTPHGLRIDRDNNVWVTDMTDHRVLKFDAQGKLLLALGKRGEPGTGPDHFNRPTDVAIAPNGEFYVSDGYGNSRVVKFSKEGKFIKEWGKKGSGEGEFNLPHSIVLDAKGRVYVGDRENNRVQIFDGDGKFLTQWKALARAAGAVNDIGIPESVLITGGKPRRHPRPIVLRGICPSPVWSR